MASAGFSGVPLSQIEATFLATSHIRAMNSVNTPPTYGNRHNFAGTLQPQAWRATNIPVQGLQPHANGQPILY